jgi:hypothetical protein
MLAQKKIAREISGASSRNCSIIVEVANRTLIREAGKKPFDDHARICAQFSRDLFFEPDQGGSVAAKLDEYSSS